MAMRFRILLVAFAVGLLALNGTASVVAVHVALRGFTLDAGLAHGTEVTGGRSYHILTASNAAVASWLQSRALGGASLMRPRSVTTS
jgi:hypothetical protein